MAFESNIVSKPISMGDISNAVNYSSLDLGTLITKGVIKYWSKAKPFEYNAIAFNEDDGITLKTRVAARKAANQGFNLGTMYSTAAAALDAAIALGSNVFAWSYQRPTSYFRMLDFDGYESNKDNYNNCPFKYRPEFTSLYDNDTLSFNSILEADWDASDFATLDGWKIGIAFRREGANSTTYFTLDKNTSVSASYFLTTGTYHFCVFFTNVSKAIDGNATAASFYLTPLPYAGAVTKQSGNGVTFLNSGVLDINLAARKTISGVVLGSLGRGRRITQVAFVYRTSASRVWSSAGSGEGDGNTYDAIDLDADGYTVGSVIITGSGMTSGNFYVRFVINGVQTYLQLIPRQDIILPQ